MRIFPKVVIPLIALFYGYGAFVHVANMADWNGFDWSKAPVKWKVLDVVYLFLDVAVVVGLITNRVFGFIAFFFAALSQIVLYTLFRGWIIDVPDAFARSPDEIAYLDTLVVFHIVTVTLMVLALWVRRTGSRRAHSSAK